MEECMFNLMIEFEKWKIIYNVEDYLDGNGFHYTSAIALENIFRNRTLWITKSDFLNDKTEYMYAINLVNKIFKENEYKYLDKNVIARANRVFKSYLARSYIFSTSKNSDSVNLWGNYSEQEGYNIGFNLKEIFNRMWDGKIFVTGNKKPNDESIKKHFIPRKDEHKSIEMSFGKVIYDTTKQEEIIVDIFNFIEHIYETFYLFKETEDIDKQNVINMGKFFNNVIGSAIHILINHIKLFKNPVFAQDEEYRIIFDVNRNLDVKKYRQFRGVFIPYIEVVFEENNYVKGLPVDFITIGPKNNLDIATKGLAQFLKSQRYKVSLNPECNDKRRLLIKDSAVPLRY